MRRLLGLIRRLIWIVLILVVVVVTAVGSLLAVLTIRGFPTTKGSLVGRGPGTGGPGDP